MEHEDIVRRLSRVPIFKELSATELDPIVKITQTRFYKHKMYVFMQDDPLDRVFFIHSGKIKIYKSDFMGKEQLISVLEPGEMFPHAGFFRKGNFPAYAEVVEDAQLIVIPIDGFEKILISYPELCIKLFKVLGEKIVDLQGRLEAQVLHNTYEQIILLLIRLCKSNGEKVEGLYKLTTQFTNRELANMIGTSRESVSRTINQVKKKSLVSQDGDGFYLINREALEQELFY
ncbi:Crp/Fnr family transcriptional regulator [Bacillus sp. AFS076308]|uniref:Crp/Fnr family transcriptional regulator n=1 Tax=unclassified Bacillus (in: firmicutes) TaxID=185979 RepID=UPI000BF5FE2F|nr:MULTISPECIES: Crp/Fnr family transcriptional regulator [unclassified Bacillus (in: firmicutes)]PFO02461.1 Crp/Fnr family transcriptional regulator [Bacillus sp. AFS076308]PGV55632.1 Crp/Fnr family transcriptional regulator [Bacillus sp. AFS037270]